MKIVVSGAGGRMGRILTEKIRETEHILVGAVDRFAPPEGGVNAFAALREKADVVIDFSNHEGTAELTEYAVRTGTPVVIATTGHTEEEKRMIAAAAEKIPVFYSGNFRWGSRCCPTSSAAQRKSFRRRISRSWRRTTTASWMRRAAPL